MNSAGGHSSLARCGALLAINVLSILIIAACGTYVPKGATVVSVKNSKLEFERGELLPSRNELADNRVIKMRWYDTNTFLTTATLAPGIYSFRARNFDGQAIQQEIKIEPDQNLYEIDVKVQRAPAEEAEVVEGPEVRGTLLGYDQRGRAQSVSVLFIGNDVVMRSANVAKDGSFSVKAPQQGPWKIEVHMLGSTPRSYIHPLIDVKGPVDLGGIVLK